MTKLAHPRHVDFSLSTLLGVQALTLFVAIPLSAGHSAAHVLLDVCHLAFAVVSVVALTRQRWLQLALLTGLFLLVATPAFGRHLLMSFGLDRTDQHEAIAFTAFAFNGAVTALVAGHVFGPGRVTAHRVQGAVLIYLNVAALFAIAYSAILSHIPGAILPTTGGVVPDRPGEQTAALTYFSLATITTTGFGDLVPISPFARSLANLESVIGQLFPATLLARIVALHLAHSNEHEIASDG